MRETAGLRRTDPLTGGEFFRYTITSAQYLNEHSNGLTSDRNTHRRMPS